MRTGIVTKKISGGGDLQNGTGTETKMQKLQVAKRWCQCESSRRTETLRPGLLATTVLKSRLTESDFGGHPPLLVRRADRTERIFSMCQKRKSKRNLQRKNSAGSKN